ncbi:MAG TPA: hypothetical protein VHM70_18890 [Polyangiaceae bacterium]|jgi:hypothetical protein|nr:hypothetical protein [Polyangiaceae bacterium]
MDRADLLGISFLLAALSFQLWVTRKVWRSEGYEPAQKRAQAKLIWFVPVIGALVAFSMLDPEPEKARDQDSNLPRV